MTEHDVRVTVGIPTFNRAGLLGESIASVLSQSHREFRLLVCDNASEDATQECVASFADSRIDYIRLDRNIGMVANFNRVIELAETEYLLVLPDDDLLYPDHLRCTLEVLERHPRVGVAHTAFDLIDISSRVVEYARKLVPVDGPVSIESGFDFLQRSMHSPWTVCWPSALFRTRAIVDADGLRVDDEPLADFPLMMRIAQDWDYAFVSSTLAATRFHAEAATAALGSYTGVGYEFRDDQLRILYNHRRRFLDGATLSKERAERLRSLAEATLRRDKVRGVATRAGLGAPWISTSRELAQLVLADRRTLLLPNTWKLCGAQLGGRFAKRTVRRMLHPPA